MNVATNWIWFYRIGHRDTQRHHDASLSKWRDINNVLEDLTVLKTRFNLTLTLKDYMQVSEDRMFACGSAADLPEVTHLLYE